MSLIDHIPRAALEQVLRSGGTMPSRVMALQDLIHAAACEQEMCAESGLPSEVLHAFTEAKLPISEISRNTTYTFVWEINVRVRYNDDDFRESEPLVAIAKGVTGGWLLVDHGQIPTTNFQTLARLLRRIKTTD